MYTYEFYLCDSFVFFILQWKNTIVGHYHTHDHFKNECCLPMRLYLLKNLFSPQMHVHCTHHNHRADIHADSRTFESLEVSTAHAFQSKQFIWGILNVYAINSQRPIQTLTHAHSYSKSYDGNGYDSMMAVESMQGMYLIFTTLCSWKYGRCMILKWRGLILVCEFFWLEFIRRMGHTGNVQRANV